MKNFAMPVKIKSKERNRIKENDIETILKMKSVHDITNYLKHNTNCSKFLGNVNTESIRRGQFEVLLKRSLFCECQNIKKFENGPIKKYLKVFIIKDEIESLKLHFRFVCGTENETTIKNYDVERYGYDNLNFLFNEKQNKRKISFKEFVESLSETIYYKILFPLIDNISTQNVFHVETALDMYYNKLLFSTIKKIFLKYKCENLKKIFGIKIDMSNIIFILRAKFNYNQHSDKIYPFIMPHYYKIKPSTVNLIVESNSFNEACTVLSKTIYKNFFSTDINLIERNFRIFNTKMLRNVFRKYSYTKFAPIIYLEIKTSEINDIVTIIEGVRYGMNSEEIKKHTSFNKV
ncbi:MAG: V-type ATPase subunit [Clostridiales bacterium]|jgi:V/A-type H+-transporting ATPase subunit C|nr:V-type ATPase subunit [Clostridiales bacterium]